MNTAGNPTLARLPTSIRSTLLQRLDPVFTVFVLASIALHLALVLYLRGVDWPRRPAYEELPERWVISPVMPLPRPDQPPIKNNDNDNAPPDTMTPRAPRPRAPAPTKSNAEEMRAEILRRAKNKGLLAVLHSMQKNGSFMADVLQGGAVDQEQEKAMRNVGGVTVAVNDPGLRNIRTDAVTSTIQHIGDLGGGSGIATVATGPETGERRVPHVENAPPTLESGTVDPIAIRSITAAIRQRMSAIRACYERALKRDPGLGGKLVVRITIAPAGQVSAVDMDDDTMGSIETTRCIQQTIRGWRFAALPETVEISYPFVFQVS